MFSEQRTCARARLCRSQCFGWSAHRPCLRTIALVSVAVFDSSQHEISKSWTPVGHRLLMVNLALLAQGWHVVALLCSFGVNSCCVSAAPKLLGELPVRLCRWLFNVHLQLAMRF